MNTDPIFAVLARAIDVSAMKQSAHAANIANAEVPGYRRLEVSFAGALEAAKAGESAQAAATAGAASATASTAAATAGTASATAGSASTSEQGVAHVVTSSESVRLDQEMAQMAQNSVRYQALITAFEKTIGLLRLAVRDGREG